MPYTMPVEGVMAWRLAYKTSDEDIYALTAE